ncbi:anaerobic ribonucleotide reductase-activating protein [compost metagenome]
MNICGYYPESINEGEGLRAALFVSGCRHYCKGCFSARTWNFSYGEPFTPEREQEIIRDIAGNPLLSGITILGGDPFFSAAEVSLFIDHLREAAPNISVWIYSGYTFEELITNPSSEEYALLTRCQVIIDGRFEQDLLDTSLLYRGSSNQRIIDIPASLQCGEVQLWSATTSFK